MMLFCYYGNSQSWSNHQLSNGMSAPCQVSQADYDANIDNFLRVLGSNHSDMYVKLINKKTEQIVREVYIKAGTSFNIRNIPQEKYYVKIAYGKNPQTDENCQFRFEQELGYEQPSHVFNYYNRLASRGLVIPCFELNLRRDKEVEKRYAQASSADIGFN